MKTRQNREILQRLEEWKNERPLPPAGEEPVFTGDNFGLPLTVILTCLGGIIGGTILVVSIPFAATNSVYLFSFLAAPVLAFGGFVIGLVVFLITLAIDYFIYRSRRRRRGWDEYAIAHGKWKLTGEENFGELAYTNPRVAMTLGVLIDKSYMDRHEKLR